MATGFQQRLATGQAAESVIARWLRARGYQILPVYGTQGRNFKGPRLFGEHELVAPDLIVFKGRKSFWVECKSKGGSTWYRGGGDLSKAGWQTGISLGYWCDYLNVSELTGLPVWLMFFQPNGKPAERDLQQGAPNTCPTGLFAGEISKLKTCIDHTCNPASNPLPESGGWGVSGMVYWRIEHLRLLASVDEVRYSNRGKEL